MPANRRQMIRSLAAGGLLLPGMLSELLGEQALGASDPLMPKKPHHRPRAKRVIFINLSAYLQHKCSERLRLRHSRQLRLTKQSGNHSNDYGCFKTS